MKRILTLILVCCTLITQAQHKETRKIAQLKSVSVSSAIQVEYVHSNKNEVVVECQNEDHLALLLTEVKNGLLEIKYKPNTRIKTNGYNKVIVYSDSKLIGAKATTSGRMRIVSPIHSPEFFIDVNSAAKIEINELTSEKVVVNAQTSGTVKAEINSTTLDVNTSSSSGVILTGKTNKANVNMSSSSDIDFNTLNIDSLSIVGSSSAKLFFNTVNNLENRLSSSAKVVYQKRPNQIRVNQISSGAKLSQNN